MMRRGTNQWTNMIDSAISVSKFQKKKGKAVIIGVGSLGGFIALRIAKEISEIVLVDNDIVMKDNLSSSVYNLNDIGIFKTEALRTKIRDRKITCKKITTINNKYIEGSTKLPEDDHLIIDCRDVMETRGNSIDIKLYISGNNVCLDCRQNVKHNSPTTGSYSISIDSNDLYKVADNICYLIFSPSFEEFYYNKKVFVNFKLNSIRTNEYSRKIAFSEIQSNLKNSSNISESIYEWDEILNRILNYNDFINCVFSINKKMPVIIRFGLSCDIDDFDEYGLPQSSYSEDLNMLLKTGINKYDKIMSQKRNIKHIYMFTHRNNNIFKIEPADIAGA